MRFRFLHASDLHLDTPFGGMRRVSDDLAGILRDATLQAWSKLVDIAIREHVAFVLLAGDIFDGADRGVRAQLAFLDGLTKLSDAGIHSFVAYGNHDPLDGWQAIHRFPERVTIFGAGQVQSVPVIRDGQTLATVHGVSYGRRDVSENLSLGYQRTGESGVHIGLLHANVGGQQDHSNYSPCALDDLRRANLDYWALGHIHARAFLSEGVPWAVYSGNTQGLSPKPSERGPKGAFIVEVDGTHLQRPRFEPLAPVQFDEVTVDIGDLGDLGELLQRVRQVGAECLEASPADHLVVRLKLTGRGALHQALIKPKAVEELERVLNDSAGAHLWWERVQVQTAPVLDLDMIRRSPGFAGELVRQRDVWQTDPQLLAQVCGSSLAPVATLDGVPPLADAEMTELLDDAMMLALGLLNPGVNA